MRYSMFLVLYPLGMAGELLVLWAGLPTLARTQVWQQRLYLYACFSSLTLRETRASGVVRHLAQRVELCILAPRCSVGGVDGVSSR